MFEMDSCDPFGYLKHKLWHLDVCPMAMHKKNYKEEGDAFPQVRDMVSLVSPVSRFVRAPKMFQHALTNLLFGLCMSVWTIDMFITRPSPHPGTPTCPFTPKVLWAMERTQTPYPFTIFTFGLAVESIKELGGVSEKMMVGVGNEWYKWLIYNNNLK